MSIQRKDCSRDENEDLGKIVMAAADKMILATKKMMTMMLMLVGCLARPG